MMKLLCVALTLVALQDPAERDNRWQDDLDELARVISERHKNAFFKISREAFFRAVDDVRKRIPELKDGQVAVEFMKLAALIGDAHTGARPGADSKVSLRRYPVTMMWFKDGLHVVTAAAEHRDLLKARVVAIGGVAIDEAARRIAVVSASDNASGARHISAHWLGMVETVAAIGLSDAERAKFTLEVDGKERVVELAPAVEPMKKVFAYGVPTAGVPINRKNLRAWYGAELLPDAKTLYCWYDRCADRKDKPIAAWSAEVLAQIDKDKPEKIVFDVRRNSGGNSTLLNPLLTGLRKRPQASARGKLFVLVDRATFSSAIFNVLDFRKDFKAVLVGLPPGGGAHHYGEIRTLALPHSKWIVQYSTKFFTLADSGTDTIQPDVEVEWTAAEFFAGKDPALEAALKF